MAKALANLAPGRCFLGVITGWEEPKAGGSMLTGFGGETCRAMKQVTFNTRSPIAIVKRNGFMGAAARSSRGASPTAESLSRRNNCRLMTFSSVRLIAGLRPCGGTLIGADESSLCSSVIT